MAMKINTDTEGFFIGESANLDEITELWQSVKSDTAEIISLLKGIKTESAKLSKSAGQIATPTRKDRRETTKANPQDRAKRVDGSKDKKPVAPTPRRTGRAGQIEPKGRDSTSTKTVQVKVVEAGTKTATNPPRTPQKRTRETSAGTPIGEVAKPVRAQRTDKEEKAPNQAVRKAVTPKRKGGQKSKSVTVQIRDKQGRFQSVTVDVPEGANAEEIARARLGKMGLEGASIVEPLKNLAGAVSEAAQSAEETDPLAGAYREIAQPLQRGWELVTGGARDESTLLGKILGSLGKLRAEFKRELRRQTDATTEAVEKAGKGKSSGGFGGLLLTLRTLPSLIKGAVVTAGGALFGGLLTKGKNLFSKIPGSSWLTVIPSILSGALSISESESSDASRAEKNKHIGKTVGGVTGSLTGLFSGAKFGAAIGSAIAPGIGTALGGLVGGTIGTIFGDRAGQKLGEWTADLVEWFKGVNLQEVFSKCSDAIVAKFDNTKVWIQETFKPLTDSFESAVNFVKEKWELATDKLAELFKPFTDKLEAAKGTVKKVTSVVENLTPIKVAKNAIQAVKQIATRPSQRYEGVGSISAKYEAGGRGAGTVSTGKGDAGGASYGTYQLSSKTGTLGKFLKQSGYAAQFEGLQAGSTAFNAKWKEIAKNDSNFGQAQHDFIASTHYAPTLEGLKARGIDLTDRGQAVQEALFSTSVQFGAGGAQRMIERVLSGQDLSNLEDVEIIRQLQDYKIANNDRLFRSSSDKVRAGTLNRARREKADLMMLAAVEPSEAVSEPSLAAPSLPKALTSSATIPATATAKTPSIPVPVAPPKLSTQEAVTVPLGADRERPNPVISIEEGIGQDVRDRKIAHIATGGISG